MVRYLRRIQRPGGSVQSWLTFLTNHREAITALESFTVPTATFHLLHCFFDIEHERRKILHYNVTSRPNAKWVVQQLREAFPEAGPHRYVIFDNDAKFNADVVGFLKETVLQPKRTSIASPWQNGIAECWVGCCRRKLLDHVIPLSEKPLRRLVREYVAYIEHDRIHDTLEKDTPHRQPVEKKPYPGATVISSERLGGLHHRYSWREAAWDGGKSPPCLRSVTHRNCNTPNDGSLRSDSGASALRPPLPENLPELNTLQGHS